MPVKMRLVLVVGSFVPVPTMSNKSERTFHFFYISLNPELLFEERLFIVDTLLYSGE